MPRSCCYLLLAGSLAATGCGSGMVPVHGKLTLDGVPLENASIQLVAQDEAGRNAHGSTDVHGQFYLNTATPGDGVRPGNYKVVVHYTEPVKIPEGLKTAEEVQAAMAEAAARHVPTIVLPVIYTRADQTPLTHRVPEDGDLTLELKSQP